MKHRYSTQNPITRPILGPRNAPYHSTTEENASCILHEGFRYCTDYYLTDELHTGVWLSDTPLDENEGAASGAVELDEAVVTPFEWVEEGKPYREFLVPANIVNGAPASRVPPEMKSLLEDQRVRDAS